MSIGAPRRVSHAHGTRRGKTLLDAVGRLDRKPEAVRHLGRPRPELLLRRKAVLRRIQLDRVEMLRVEREEGASVEAWRIEARLPGRVAPPGRPDVRAAHVLTRA